MLVEFNYSLLYSFILSGYRYFLYEPHENHGIITPLYFDYTDIAELGSNAYIIPITDEQGLQMASGYVDLLEDFTFYFNLKDHV